MDMPINVLVVDDSDFMRQAVGRILESDPLIRVAGMACNGEDALEKIVRLKPDVVTMDIDMPQMDGLTAIRHLMIRCPVPVVVLSSLFSHGAVTFEALRLGVVDFISKPSGAVSRNIETCALNVTQRIRLARSVRLGNIRRVKLSRPDSRERLIERYGYRSLDYLVAIGTTLGGPNTMIRLLTRLPASLPAAIVSVQEISPGILPAFVRQFDKHVLWRVEEARDNMVLEQGTCYISSNEKKLAVRMDGAGTPLLRVEESESQPLDLLFASAAELFQNHTIGVLMSGTGTDGARGFARINRVSGVTIAQETQCCIYPNLTENAVKQGVVDRVVDEKLLDGVIRSVMA